VDRHVHCSVLYIVGHAVTQVVFHITTVRTKRVCQFKDTSCFTLRGNLFR